MLKTESSDHTNRNETAPNTLSTLTPTLFLDMIKAGAHGIISNEALLNRINVFPVSDRDTGSNMASLMRYLIAQPYSTSELSLMLQQIADASLLGACGNSGMILSAFLVGFASNKELSANKTVTKEVFVNCLDLGVKQAYLSVSDPAEGTILSVMSAWFSSCVHAIKQTNDFLIVFKNSLTAAEEALKKTEFQLPALESNHVVDAGALGFVKFIEGMYQYLVNPLKNWTAPLETISQEMHVEHCGTTEPNYQYCMETLCCGSDFDINHIKERLHSLCDSLVINQSPHYLKVHLHTNDIQTITQLLKQQGAIQHQKIDDMKKQWNTSHARKHRIALVTDSSADIPDEWLAQEQIHVLPLQIRLGKHTLIDRMTVNLKELYEQIASDNQSAGTATPAPEVISRYLRFLTTHYDSIIVITISSKLSSTYQTIAKQAADIPSAKIDVIDSKKSSAAQGLLVMKAARWIAEGHDHQTVINKISELRDDTHLFVLINKFKTLAKGGRAPDVFRMLAEWAHFNPIIAMNRHGKTTLAGFTLSKKASWRKIMKLLQRIKQKSGIRSAAIVHTTALETANEFAEYIQQKTGIVINFIRETSCSLGLHTGEGCVAIAISRESLE